MEPLPTVLVWTLPAALIACWVAGCGGKHRLLDGAAGSAETASELDGGSCENTTQEGDPDWRRQQHELCGLTSSLLAIAEDEACTAEDPQRCWTSCGPGNIGFAALTCVAGFYVKDTACQYDPSMDYNCYRLPKPQEVHPGCPTDAADAPMHNDLCDLPPCHVCGGTTEGQTTGYLYALQGPKAGHCVCHRAIHADDGKWQCGTSWPCPVGCGC
jgi:hypothetical protein